MIEIKFSGSVAEVFAEIAAMAATVGVQPGTAVSPGAYEVAASPDTAETETPASEAPVAKAKKTRKAKAVETKEDTENGEEQENGEDGEQESAETDNESEDSGNETISAKANGASPGEALKLKDASIKKLKAAHASGMVKEVKGILVKYGEGAKSFSEMDPSLFKAVAKEIKNWNVE